MNNKHVLKRIIKSKRCAKRITLVLAFLIALSVCLMTPGVYAEEGLDPGSDADAASSGADAASNDAGSVTPAPSNVPVTPASSPTAADLRNDLEDVNAGIDQAKDEYEQAVKEIKELEARITTLEAQIAETEGEIRVLEGQIVENDAIKYDLQIQIQALESDIYDQNSALNKRLRVMYQTGDQGVLSVLLSSESFIDFLTNIEMVRRIHECDIEFLKELEIKLDDLEEKKLSVEEIEALLNTQKNALQDKRDSLSADKASLASAKGRVQEIRDKAAEEIERLQKESERIKQELANMVSQWGDYAGGAMAWPVLGPVTSEYGMRYHPITGRYVMHNGIDIGVAYGTPVHAGADGIVISSGWNNGGYGYLVMIDNGSGIVTLYAHNQSLAVSAGTVVSRGQIIAYAGSTGNSTGPHVHFEVRVKGSPQNPRGWLG